MRWFGASSWCPATDTGERVDVPVGEGCPGCRRLIEAYDEGFVFPHLPSGYTALHRRCFEESLDLPRGRGSAPDR